MLRAFRKEIIIAHCDQNTSATVLKLMAQANTTGYMFLKHFGDKNKVINPTFVLLLFGRQNFLSIFIKSKFKIEIEIKTLTFTTYNFWPFAGDFLLQQNVLVRIGPTSFDRLSVYSVFERPFSSLRR